jgi:uncharacterized protein YacL
VSAQFGPAIVRVVVLAAAAGAGLALGPSGPNIWLGGIGFLLGVLVLVLERQARGVQIERLFWGIAGALLGMALGLSVGTALGAVVPGAGPLGRGLFGLLFAYLGSAVVLAKLDEFAELSARMFPRRARGQQASKILDTSVIIDGRIVDLCESGFVEGTLVVPQFVLRELQQLADSSDGLKRARAKRGFDVLERLQRTARVSVEIDGRDFPGVRDVDQKLLELAKTTGDKVVTNDHALNKLAGLSGVAVLNVNELANALRPVVLPGEPMNVLVVREGRESGQGVAYLDDGTMVVVDQGRRLIGQAVDVTVTQLLQTTAGRMIFARPRDDEGHSR